MERAFIITLRLAAGLAVGFWGLSKLLFVNDWVGPYRNRRKTNVLQPLDIRRVSRRRTRS